MTNDRGDMRKTFVGQMFWGKGNSYLQAKIPNQPIKACLNVPGPQS